MKKRGVLNARLMGELAALGHTDSIVIADAGFPIPKGCNTIDLALVKGIPSFLDVLKAVLNEIIVERYILFAPIVEANPDMYATVKDMLKNQKDDLCDPDAFLALAKEAKVIVRTAEFSPCCNMILYSASGVEELCRQLEVSFE